MLSQFKSYERITEFTAIDPELLDTSHKLMVSFVKLCALSIKIQKSGRWKSIKFSAKEALFGDTSGVKNELDRFRALIKRQGAVQGTVTLEHVLRSKKHLLELHTKADDQSHQIADVSNHLEMLTTAESKRETETETQTQLERIQERFPSCKEMNETSKRTSDNNFHGCVPDSGSWLLGLPEYKGWIENDPSVNPLLLLAGQV